MGRAPCCDKANVKKGPWSPEEDAKLKDYIQQHGTGGNWIALPNKVGLKRCGKSCRLRWLNYLRPNIKHGEFSDAEDKIICSLFASIGTRWSIIASQLPGRTDNDIKNYWNTKLKKKMMAIHHSAESYKPQQVALSSTLQNSTPPSSLLFTDSSSSNNFTASGSFSYSSTTTSSLLSGNSSTSVPANPIFQAQESFNIGPTQKCQFKDSNISNFVLGGEAISCCSSDGSCNNNQVSHVIEQELGDHASFVEQIGAVNYLYNGEKLMLSNSGSADEWTEKQNGLWGENPLDYGLEEIKQLISTNSTTCNNNFLFDDKKTEENVMYY